MKKLIFVDSDGTLKNSKGEISETTKDILKKLKEKNIEVIITTGRPRYHALKVKNLSNASRYIISSNGAEVYDEEEDKVIYGNYLDKEEVLHVYDIVNSNNGRCMMTIEGKEVVLDNPKNVNQVKLEDNLDSYLDSHKVKQLFIRIDNEKDANKIYETIRELDGMKIVNESSYFQDGVVEEKGIWFSVANDDVNKGLAIKKICEYLKIDLKDTYGFGNDYNDIDMFRVVNHSIVTANANDELKAIAKITTKSNDEDGVAKFLEELFLHDKEGE